MIETQQTEQNSQITLKLTGKNLSTLENIHKYKNLIDLDVSSNNLTNEIPNLKQLKYLRKINLSDNNLQQIWELPPTIEILILSNNLISLISPQLLQLQSLTNLNLSHNLLTTIDGIEKLISIQQLFLSNNQLKKIDKLMELKFLKELDCENNEINHESQLKVFQSHQFLEVLNVKGNPLIIDQANDNDFFSNYLPDSLTYYNDGIFYRDFESLKESITFQNQQNLINEKSQSSPSTSKINLATNSEQNLASESNYESNSDLHTKSSKISQFQRYEKYQQDNEQALLENQLSFNISSYQVKINEENKSNASQSEHRQEKKQKFNMKLDLTALINQNQQYMNQKQIQSYKPLSGNKSKFTIGSYSSGNSIRDNAKAFNQFKLDSNSKREQYFQKDKTKLQTEDSNQLSSGTMKQKDYSEDEEYIMLKTENEVNKSQLVQITKLYSDFQKKIHDQYELIFNYASKYSN